MTIGEQLALVISALLNETRFKAKIEDYVLKIWELIEHSSFTNVNGLKHSTRNVKDCLLYNHPRVIKTPVQLSRLKITENVCYKHNVEFIKHCTSSVKGIKRS